MGASVAMRCAARSGDATLPAVSNVNESKLIEKLRRIEALHAGATTDGERVAAAEAKKRILARLAEVQKADPPVEYKFTLADPWSRQVFNALLRRYGLRPYRYARQHRQTVMVKVSRSFVNETLWPQFQALSTELHTYLREVTDRVIHEALDASSGEADEVAGTPQLGGGEKE
jgi:hypothetical protein